MIVAVLYPLVFMLVWLAFKLVFFLRLKGIRNIPGRGTSLLVCANHTGYSDPIFVTMPFGPFRRIRYMAKSTLFRIGWKRYFLHAFGAFPVNQRTSDVGSIRHAIDEIKKGKPVVVFPEGGRRLRGLDNLDALPGIGLIALKAEAYILPIYITPYLSPFKRKTVVVGEAFKPERLEGERPSEAYHRIALDTLERVRKLGESVGEGW